MDQKQLMKFFPLDPFDMTLEQTEAIGAVWGAAKLYAETVNRLLPESQAKHQMIMEFFHSVRQVEMSLRLDGPSRTVNMIVTTRQ